MDDVNVLDDEMGWPHTIRERRSGQLSKADQAVIDTWWRRLSTRDRRGLLPLFDARADSCSFNAMATREGATSFRRVAITVQGRFVDDDADGADEAFPIDLYEYLINHEIYLNDGPKYHICTRHQAAESAVRAGKIPATFSCPVASSICPMERILALAPGRSLRFEVHVDP